MKLITIVAAAVLIACGCGGGSGSGDSSTVRVRAINLSQSVASAEFVTDFATVGTGLGYTFGSPYGDIRGGMQDVVLRQTGTSTVIDAGVFDLSNGPYTLLAIGATGNSARPVELLLMGDDHTLPPSANARFRLLFAAAGEPGPIDIYVTGNSDSIDAISPTFSNVSYGSTTAYTARNILTPTRIRATTAGTKTVLADSNFTFVDGAVMTIAFADQGGGVEQFVPYRDR